MRISFSASDQGRGADARCLDPKRYPQAADLRGLLARCSQQCRAAPTSRLSPLMTTLCRKRSCTAGFSAEFVMPRSTYCVKKAPFPLSVKSLAAQAGGVASDTSAPKKPNLIIAAPRGHRVPALLGTNTPASNYSTKAFVILNQKNAGGSLCFRAVACLHPTIFAQIGKVLSEGPLWVISRRSLQRPSTSALGQKRTSTPSTPYVR